MLAMLLIEDMSTLLMMLKDCCRSQVRVPLLCCLDFTIAIAIAIVRSRSGCSCSYRCGVPVPVVVVVFAVVFRLRLEGGRHDNALDSRRVNIVDADNGLLSETNKQNALDCNCN